MKYKYCPKCKSEYEEWVTLCADCKEQLVDTLPRELPKEYMKFKELQFTFNQGDIAFIKSIFDSNNIRYYIKDEEFMLVRPLVQPAGVMVDEKQFEEAKELLKGFKGRFTGLSMGESPE